MASLAIFSASRVLHGLLVVSVLAVIAAATFVIGMRNSTAPDAAANDPSQIGRMDIEAQFKGPLQDTLIQRLRDPATGAVCYVYLPVRVQHSQPMEDGVVVYGSNAVGSISCLPH